MSKNNLREYYVKGNKKTDGMYTELLSMDVDSARKLEFPNLEIPKVIMEGKVEG